jgi:hypothetical protein
VSIWPVRVLTMLMLHRYVLSACRMVPVRAVQSFLLVFCRGLKCGLKVVGATPHEVGHAQVRDAKVIPLFLHGPDLASQGRAQGRV